MAQPAEGSFLLGTSTSLWGGASDMVTSYSSNTGGISFTKSEVEEEGKTIDGPKLTNVNFSPRVGYTFLDGFVGGLKVDVYSSQAKYENDEHTSDTKHTLSGISAGPFVRYFIPMGSNAQPFVEAEVCVGTLSDRYTVSEFESDNRYSTLHLAGGVGVAFFFNDNVSFDVMAAYSYNSSTNDDSKVDWKGVTKGFGLGIGLTIFLNTP